MYVDSAMCCGRPLKETFYNSQTPKALYNFETLGYIFAEGISWRLEFD